jgi:hypothetical protein
MFLSFDDLIFDIKRLSKVIIFGIIMIYEV